MTGINIVHIPYKGAGPALTDLVGGWPAGGRHGRRFERFAQVCQDLAHRPWLWWNAISRMWPPQLGPSLSRNSNGDSSTTPLVLSRVDFRPRERRRAS